MIEAPRAPGFSSLGLLVCLSVACDHASPSETPRDASEPVRAALAHDAGSLEVTSARAPAPPAEKPRVRMQVRALVGAVRADCPLAEGSDIVSTCTASLERGEQLTLSLDDHVRVVLEGPATAQLLPSGLPALLLREGQLTLDVAPHGLRASESAFWLATPTLRLDVADNVRVALRASEQTSALVVVSGYLTVSRAEGALAVPAGSALCVSRRDKKLLPQSASTLERAVVQLQKQTTCRGPVTRAPAEVRALLEQDFDVALTSVARASEREHDMLAEHARLVAAGDGRALTLRADLAHVGAELLRSRERARALGAQLEAHEVARTATPTTLALRTRASSLLVHE